MNTTRTDPRMKAFYALTASEQRSAIRQMADMGYGANTIARATGLSVEAVRLALTAHLHTEETP